MLKFVYSFFLGLLLAVFVGVGVATFYPTPKAPEYPAVLQTSKSPDAYSDQQRKVDEQFQKDQKSYSDRLSSYNRNVALIVLSAAVILVVLGLTLHAWVDVLADGLLLGGVFSLLYSIGRSFAGGNPRYSFVIVSAGLVITGVVGYIKFIQPQSKPVPVKKK